MTSTVLSGLRVGFFGHGLRRTLFTQNQVPQAAAAAAAAQQTVERYEPREKRAPLPSIPDYYAGKNVFLTGGTGFCGKAIIEKLLRSCPDVRAIYCLTRAKKDASAQERLHNIFNDTLFDTLKRIDREQSFKHKVHAIPGDISLDNFGISDKDHLMLREKVDISMHLAASVTFNDPINKAIEQNVLGVRRMLNFAKSLNNLEAHVQVSTAYSQSDRIWKNVKEEVYAPNVPYEEAIELARTLPKEQLPELRQRVVGSHQNAYMATKGMAEYLISQEAGDLPIAIVRPSQVITTYKDPVPGWIDSTANHGLAQIVYMVGLGACRVLEGHPELWFDMVPGELCTNSAIAAAWKIGVDPPENMPPIYNVTSSTLNPGQMGDFVKIVNDTLEETPFSNAVRKSVSNDWMVNTRGKYLRRKIANSWIPGVLGHGIETLTGKQKKMALKLAYFSDKMNQTTRFFLLHRYYFETDNFTNLIDSLSPSDSKEFWMDVREIDWTRAIQSYTLGITKHINKQDLPQEKIP